MSNRGLGSLIVVALLALLAWNTLFTVSEKERAILLKFGEIVDADLPPGLHWKVPVLHEVRRFDARVLTFDTSPQRYLTVEKKALMVDSFIKWRIETVKDYYTATGGDEFIAARLLMPRVDQGLRNQVGVRAMHEVVSGERDQLMADLTVNLNAITRKELGIEILDIRVKRIDLPAEVSQAVFDRMNSEREREARELRSKGRELAEGIQADADRQRRVILASAYRDSEKIRGEGDAQAAAIYAKAYEQDREFYRFYRSLQAYKEVFKDQGDLLVLEPDGAFFDYLKSQDQK